MPKKPHTFRLDEDLVIKAKKAGTKHKRDLTNVVEVALTEYIKNPK